MNQQRTFEQLLSDITSKMKELAPEKKFFEMKTEYLLDDFLELGMMMYHNPELKNSQQLIDFRENTAELLRVIGSDQIYWFIRNAIWANLANGEVYDGYSNFSQTMRSAVEFVIDIYNNRYKFADPLEEADEVILRRYKEFELDDNPEMPESHWWWHYSATEYSPVIEES